MDPDKLGTSFRQGDDPLLPEPYHTKYLYLINASHGFLLIHIFQETYLGILHVSGTDTSRVLYVYTYVTGFLYDREGGYVTLLGDNILIVKP